MERRCLQIGILHFMSEAVCDGRYIALMMVTVCMVTDMAVSRIYNFLTVPAAAAGAALLIAGGRASELPSAALMALLTMVSLFPFYRMHGIGAGDCKLLMALCFLLARGEYITCFCISFVLGAVIALLLLVFSRGQSRRIHFAVPVGISTVFCIGGVLEPVYRYL